jgi:hypothetical protein
LAQAMGVVRNLSGVVKVTPDSCGTSTFIGGRAVRGLARLCE